MASIHFEASKPMLPTALEQRLEQRLRVEHSDYVESWSTCVHAFSSWRYMPNLQVVGHECPDCGWFEAYTPRPRYS